MKNNELKRSDVKVVRKALVLCCGHGLVSEALRQAGYKLLGGIDTSEASQEVYKLNFPNSKFLLKSIRELDVQTICDEFKIQPGEIDFTEISNPCTDTSTTGEQVLFSATNDLYFVAAKLAIQLRSKVILFENVKALSEKKMNILLAMLNAILKREGADYWIDTVVLDSHLYGDSQSRSRVFIQMTLKSLGKPVWPIPVNVSKRKNISDVIPNAEYLVSTNFGERIYYPHEPAPTITAHPNLKVFDQDGLRKVSTIELADFMGLPKNFQLTGSIASQELGLGNGVCVNVMREIVSRIKNCVLDLEKPKESVTTSLVNLVEEQIETELDDMSNQQMQSGLEESHIKWTNFTWNPWTGCKKISAGCKYCYMFRDGDRYGNDHHQIKKTTPSTFNKPLKINEPKMVFTCSWSDFFIEEADEWRDEAWDIIRKTPHLTYQILTKRPERITQCLPKDWNEGYPNVWLGVTVENQESVNRAEILAKIPAQIRFISAEPLLGPLDLLTPLNATLMQCFHWLIIGGESGNNTGKHLYRPCKTDWISQLIMDTTTHSEVKIFIKQTGTYLAKELGLKKRHGDDVAEFPEWMQIQEWPSTNKDDTDDLKSAALLANKLTD